MNETYNEWKRDCVNIEVTKNTNDELEIYISWPIPSKKNQKQVFRWRVLPSKNYIRWHKIVSEKLSNINCNYNKFPCSLSMVSIAWTKARWDADNILTSCLDLLVDVWILPDDNKFILPEVKIRNVWYAKNCWLARINITPYLSNSYLIEEEHRWKDILSYKHYLDWVAIHNEAN